MAGDARAPGQPELQGQLAGRADSISTRVTQFAARWTAQVALKGPADGRFASRAEHGQRHREHRRRPELAGESD
jgi:hypothetical protein